MYFPGEQPSQIEALLEAYDRLCQTIDLDAVAANFVRISLLTTWAQDATQMGLSEVRFYAVPTRARIPQPRMAATSIDPLAIIANWRPGREADQHRVYISSDANAVANGTAPSYIVDTPSISGTTLGLELNQSYYWRVDEVNESQDPTEWQGDVWRFSTQTSFTVDDFESYTNDAETLSRPFQTWIDGWGYTNPAPGKAGNNTGATVGHDIFSMESPYYEGLLMETDAVISGSEQSLPVYYDNTGENGKLNYSQIDRTWSSGQDWSVSGINTLTMHVRGNPVPFVEDGAGHITITAAGADIFGAADEFRFVYKQINGNGSIIARVNSILGVDDWSLAGLMIRQRLTADTRFAGVFVTAENGVRMRIREQVGGAADSDTEDADGNPIATDEQKAVKAPAWIKLERSGTFNFFAYYATTEGTPTEADWIPFAWNSQRVFMTGPIYVGLAVSSHSAGKYTVAEFSDIQTEGVSGQWQVESIGVPQPENGPESMYVILEDRAGNTAVATYPDTSIVTSMDFVPWNIPTDTFVNGGVNMADITRMSIGVGDRTNAAAGGAGMLVIDDIWLTRIDQ